MKFMSLLTKVVFLMNQIPSQVRNDLSVKDILSSLINAIYTSSGEI